MPQLPDLVDEADWLARARAGDNAAFDRLVAPRRRQLHAHCYRMLGSPFDADDALQETLLAAWRGIASFEGRSALGTWLYRIATHVCLRLISQRPRRITSPDHGAPLQATAELGEPVAGPVWLEPLPDAEWVGTHEDPSTTLQRRESVALAFVAALQHLPATQRAVLLLREVLEYSAAEAAEMLDTSVASVNSALQRAQKTMKERTPAAVEPGGQQWLGEHHADGLLQRFVSAWESCDIDAMASLLAEDARFTMPPLPAWFDGRRFALMFFAERVFETPWRLQPLRGNGQPGFACYMKHPGADRFTPGGVVLLRLRDGLIASIDSFIDPAVCRRFGMPDELI
ncbi:RNA polymerase subunit sigma-70 [Ramlibacter sp. WS9]|uniref:RNA polymerase subunit sigma-70 n=1 Tax=Ramlibacter sp. WS9 TaxID=1882741 RepID=UPI0011414F93|nr:RNA polymerase subunit sigma-70 [Ramlibacter sp. WS9]ROZ69389.1 sigma-70 family RNA polymerase sigma factor [Ramlibacter sp. WS9]